jgi:branched-chain amino acid transport system ATP-binding protein
MLRVKELNAGYKELQILFDVNAAIDEGITAFIGPNGSGKSTLLKAIFGLTTIYGGRITYNGADITLMKPHAKTRLGITYLPQIENVFPTLSVKENLVIAGYTLDKGALKERMDAALDIFPELEGLMRKKAGVLSGGEKQFLAISSTLIRNSEVLMLDEPTAHLSPKLAESVFKKIVELRDRLKLKIALVEQNIGGALEISDRANLLVSGKIVFSGDAGELLARVKQEKQIGDEKERREIEA